MRFISKFFQKIYLYFQTTKVYAWLNANDDEYICQRKTFSFIYGLLIGFIFWKIYLTNFNLFIFNPFTVLCITMLFVGKLN